MGGLATSDVLTWLAVTLLLGGAAGAAAGNALAANWQPFGRAVGFGAIIAAGACFLCWALFGVRAIPASDVLLGLRDGRIGDGVSGLAGWAGSFAIVTGFAYAAWRITRERQMQRQYPFLFGEQDGGD